MKKIIVVTDSSSGISQAEAEQNGLVVIPIPFTIDGKEYQVKRDGAQIVVFDTLKKLQKCGKNWKEYKPLRRV